ncbi:MAG: HupE/UreJ family protein [Kiloniellales bacterium]
MGRRAALAITLLLLPATAQAHSAIPGAGDFYNGLLHPLIVPAHVLALLAIGLCLGQREAAHAQLAVPTFALLLLLGLALASIGVGEASAAALLRPTLLALVLIAGIAVAAAAALPRLASAALAAAGALALGLDSAAEAEGLRERLVTLAGTWVGAHLALLNVVGITAFARRRWHKLGVRILGSWTAASALLVLALALRR